MAAGAFLSCSVEFFWDNQSWEAAPLESGVKERDLKTGVILDLLGFPLFYLPLSVETVFFFPLKTVAKCCAMIRGMPGRTWAVN